MDFLKRLWQKIKYPKTIWLVLFYIAFLFVAAGTIVLVVLVKQQTVFHYILYLVSAVMLAYAVYLSIIIYPKVKQGIINILNKNKYTRVMLKNYGYRTFMFSTCTFIINLAYVVLMGVFGIIAGSAWYISMASFYAVLAFMKGSVFYSKRKYNTQVKKAKVYKLCGIMLIVLTLIFAGLSVLIYTSNMSFKYAGLMIYVVATFTFFIFGLAIYNLFKARKQDNLYIQSLRNINFAKSLVSIFVLQIALIQAFSPQGSSLNLGFVHSISGLGVSALILILGIFMIIKANKTLKEYYLKAEKNKNEEDLKENFDNDDKNVVNENLKKTDDFYV